MISTVAENYQNSVQTVHDLLGRPQFVDGVELFDGRLTHSLRELFDTCEHLMRRLENHVHAATWDDSNFSSHYEEEFDGFGENFRERLISFRLQLQSVIDRLQETKRRHGL